METVETKEEIRDIVRVLDIAVHDIKNLQEQIKEVKQDMRDMRQEIRELRKELNVKFQWMIGLLIGSWITIILTQY